MRFCKLMLVGIVLFSGSCSCSSKKPADKIEDLSDSSLDTWIEILIQNYHIGGGIGIGIVKDGQVILEKAYGYSDYHRKVKATAATPFYIASITKSFMGTLAMILHENGEINIEEELASHLPFQASGKLDLEGKSVEDLFTHTSGIGNTTVAIKTAYTGNFTKKEILKDLENFSYPVSDGYQYSNLGYIIGSLILEERLGTSWKELLKMRLLEPIGMLNTSALVSSYAKDVIAKPHTYSNDSISVGEFLKKDDTMHAAGGLITTVEDMNKWMNFHLTANPELLSQEALNYIHSDLVGFYGRSGSFNSYGYGMGWNQADWNEYEVSWHGGGYPGFRSLCIIVPEEQLGITILMNQVTPAINLLADYLLGKHLVVSDFESYLSEREQWISQQWERYQFLRDSTLEAGTKSYSNHRSLQDYEGVYYNKEYGEVLIKSDSNTLAIILGNLSFSSNYVGDDRFFFFNDADQLYGSIDFYFHNDLNNQASSLDFDGVEYKKVNVKGQNNR